MRRKWINLMLCKVKCERKQVFLPSKVLAYLLALKQSVFQLLSFRVVVCSSEKFCYKFSSLDKQIVELDL